MSELRSQVRADLHKQLLWLTPGAGLQDAESMVRFHGAILAEGDKFKAAGLPFDVLADLTDAPVETAGVADAIRETMDELRARGMRRSANIVSNVIKKLQMTRVSQSDKVGFFRSEEEALAWLAE